ncbi:flagellar motor switch protein FliG [Breznakiella homolactica]|uniref:Flagellar motor switch protein FliG n=2 Tax=Breznakiella homolactica TaxID=2798577 RepID=A0A7T7XRY1_9SPIR|nr:flagellar motor switch protein FliG [Breznakiella homolactica]
MNNARRIAAYQKSVSDGKTASELPKKGNPADPADKIPRVSPVETESTGGFIKTRKKAGSRAPEEPKKRFIKTVPPGKDEETPSPREEKYRRVAKFLILIGSEDASQILAKLEPGQVEEITREISSIRGVTPEEADSILYEFRSLLSRNYTAAGHVSGGIDAARDILHAAYGKEQGESLLRRAVPEAIENPLTFMEDFSGEQIAMLLRNESAATAALVLSRLSPKATAAALANISPEKKLEIVKRIARLGESPPEVLERVAASLREKARSIGKTDTEDIDGRAALAQILKYSDSSFGERILDELETDDPELSQDLKERLNTLEDVIKAEDKPIQAKLRTMSDRDIALLLKGKSGGFAEKIYSNMSASRRAIVREEGELLGPVPKRDVDAADNDFLVWFRAGRDEGRIILVDDDDVVG